jgi:hypothetical protein
MKLAQAIDDASLEDTATPSGTDPLILHAIELACARTTQEPEALASLKLEFTGDHAIWNVRSLAGIERCARLTKLTARGIGLVDVSAVASLEKLKTLSLSMNPIKDYSPIFGLASLTSLEVMSTRLKNLAPITALAKLRKLWLSENAIVDISPLAELRELTYLSLGGTEVEDLAPIAELPKLENLVLRDCKQLVIERGNETYRIIASLKQRGVDVYVEHPAFDAPPPTATPRDRRASRSRSTPARASSRARAAR